MINDIDNESESNDNGDDSSIGSDSEWHKHVGELLIDDNLNQTAYYWEINSHFSYNMF
jgi:hypothetical protein